ncbi:molybdenum cofactor guanylyltransferase [Bacillus changyiensis]|uniref:molybdenum cofactor guanylyltransferase n=1 Tax=Bacillus changyiensis TaxID=3004103 RepID=UPI0022E30BB1|nr:molybdenum cofactor guanylyltransferase [Bacillus changyiensis]MDA1475731.1 molybdenum cofactor guanylyltransferase [Bacillus changyiensis]
MKPVHVLLAGGLSRRFGEPKAFALWENKPFYQWCKQAMGGKVVILSHSELLDRFKNNGEISVIEDIDPFKGKGPLAGIYTAMEHQDGDCYVVLACDTPLIRQNTMTTLKKSMSLETDAVVIVANGQVQPLVAVYHKRVKPVLYEQLCQNELKLSNFLSRIRVTYIHAETIGAKASEFFNMNEKSDLEIIKEGF